MKFKPFPYETYALDKAFIGREKEKALVLSHIKKSTNIALISKRRMGKSSLIKEVLRDIDDEYLCIYVDIFDITSKEDFINLLLKEASNSLKGSVTEIAIQLRSIFKRVIPDFSIDSNGVPHIKPTTKSLDYEEMVSDFFALIFKLSKKYKVVIAIDEFQQIALIKDTKIDALFRKYMQEPKDISYVFLGSKRHMMIELFKYKSPLYEMATINELGALKDEEVSQYVIKHIDIDIELVNEVITICDRETKLMQHIFHILHESYRGKKINMEDIQSTIDEIINIKDSSYRVIYGELSLNQKKALKVISQNNSNIYGKNTLDIYQIQKESLSSALKQLFKKEYIDKNDNNWFIPDRAFEMWCSRL